MSNSQWSSEWERHWETGARINRKTSNCFICVFQICFLVFLLCAILYKTIPSLSFLLAVYIVKEHFSLCLVSKFVREYILGSLLQSRSAISCVACAGKHFCVLGFIWSRCPNLSQTETNKVHNFQTESAHLPVLQTRWNSPGVHCIMNKTCSLFLFLSLLSLCV